MTDMATLAQTGVPEGGQRAAGFTPTARHPAMVGQMLAEPVKVTTVRRAPGQ